MYAYACNEHLNVIWNRGKTQTEREEIASSVPEANYEFDSVISYL